MTLHAKQTLHAYHIGARKIDEEEHTLERRCETDGRVCVRYFVEFLWKILPDLGLLSLIVVGVLSPELELYG